MDSSGPTFDRSKLKKNDLDIIKFIEAQNLERAKKLIKIRTRNRLTAGTIGLGVLGIYAYSIYSVKQETFFDDFEEPAKSTQ